MLFSILGVELEYGFPLPYQTQALHRIFDPVPCLGTPKLGFKGINTTNIFLNYFYLGLLVMCFILALGNRP